MTRVGVTYSVFKLIFLVIFEYLKSFDENEILNFEIIDFLSTTTLPSLQLVSRNQEEYFPKVQAQSIQWFGRRLLVQILSISVAVVSVSRLGSEMRG